MSYLREGKADPVEIILDLLESEDEMARIELFGKMFEDYRDVIEACNIHQRTFFRRLKKHGKKVRQVVDKY